MIQDREAAKAKVAETLRKRRAAHKAPDLKSQPTLKQEVAPVDNGVPLAEGGDPNPIPDFSPENDKGYFGESIDRQGGWGLSPETRAWLGADDSAYGESYFNDVKRPIQNWLANVADLGFRGVQGVQAGVESVAQLGDDAIDATGFNDWQKQYTGNDFAPGKGLLALGEAIPDLPIKTGPSVPLGKRPTAAQNKVFNDAIHAGDVDTALSTLEEVSGNPRTPETVASVQGAVEAAKKDRKGKYQIAPDEATVEAPVASIHDKKIAQIENDLKSGKLKGDKLDDAVDYLDEAYAQGADVTDLHDRVMQQESQEFSRKYERNDNTPESAKEITDREINKIYNDWNRVESVAAEDAVAQRALDAHRREAAAMSDSELDDSIAYNNRFAARGQAERRTAYAEEKVRRSVMTSPEASSIPQEPINPQTAPRVEKPSDTPHPESPEGKLLGALGGAKKRLNEQETLRSAERGERIKAANAAGEGLTGQDKFYAQKGALKGPLSKVTVEDIRQQFSQEDLDGLFNRLETVPGWRFYDTLNAREGLRRLLDGELPRPSELKKLQEAFGTETVKSLVENRGTVKKAFNPEADQIEMFTGEEITSTGPMRYLSPEPKPIDPNKFIDDPKQGDFFKDKPKFNPSTKPGTPDAPAAKDGTWLPGLSNVASLSKALSATGDLSAPFRQGIFMVSRPEFYKSMGTMFNQFRHGFGKSDVAFDDLMNSLQSRPTSHLYEEAGLFLGDPRKHIGAREEQFASELAEKIPVFGRAAKASDRAFTGYLNRLRADVFDDIIARASERGSDIIENPEKLKALGRYINSATGRGDLGKIGNQAAPLLNGIFFSPRLAKARIDMMNPMTYVKLPAEVRREAMRDLFGFSAITSSVLGLAALSGADVETDPRSSNFGKARVGNTRYDVLGGFGQYATLAARLASGQSKKENDRIMELDGKGFNLNRFDVALRFLTNKEAPMASLVTDMLRGKDAIGEPVKFPDAVIKRFIPLFAQDIYKGYEDEGLVGAAKVTPSFFGVGVQTYDSESPFTKSTGLLSSQPITDDPVKAELYRIGNALPEAKLRGPTRTISIDGENVKLDDEEFANYQEMAGNYVADDMKELMKDPNWASMPDSDKQEIVLELIKEGKAKARDEIREAKAGPEDAEAPAAPEGEEFTFGVPTSGKRSRAKNSKVGGVTNSDHLDGNGMDFVPAKGVSWTQLTEEAKKFFGPDAKVIHELPGYRNGAYHKEHVHVSAPGLNAPEL